MLGATFSMPRFLAILLILSLPIQRAGAEASSWWKDFVSRVDQQLQQWHKAISEHEARLATLAHIPPEQTGERLGYHSRLTMQNTQPWVQVDLGSVQPVDRIVVVPVMLPHEQGGIEGYGFPHRYRIDVSDDGTTFDLQRGIDFTAADQPNPGRLPVVVSWTGSTRYVRFTATRPAGSKTSNRDQYPSLALAEIMVLHGDVNLAAGCPVTAPTSREAPPVWSLQNLTDGESILGGPVSAATVPRQGYHALTFEHADTPLAIAFDLGEPRLLDDVRLFPMQWAGYPHWLGFGFPVRFKVECADNADFTRPIVLADQTAADFPNPGMNPVVISASHATARYVRLNVSRLWQRFTDHTLALSEIQIYSEGRNIAPAARLTAPESFPAKEWKAEYLVDGNASDNPILPLPQWISEWQVSAALEGELATLIKQRDERQEAWQHNSLLAAGALMGAGFAALLVFAWRSSRLRRRELAALRERIARDLHDEVGSNLAGIALLSREATKMETVQREALLDDIGRIAEETAGSMRDLVWMIQPSAPGDLVGAFRQCAERILSGKAIHFEPSAQTLPAKLSIDFKRQLYLIYREGLQNVAKHSNARSVTIRLQRSGSWLHLMVKDDGRGFQTSGDGSASRGFGLENMQQRALKLGGECVVTSRPEQGTEVLVKVRC